MDNRPIGIFDSGVGGLTVALEIQRQLPHEHVVYFGDTGRNPYGTRPVEQIAEFCTQIGRFLEAHDAKCIVIACNTATMAALEHMQKNCHVPVFGVIAPSVETALAATKNNKIGVLATNATINSGVFQARLKAGNAETEVFGQGCPLFVNLAEECVLDNEITYHTAKMYVEPMLEKGVDTIILGCTHFPLHETSIRRVIGEEVTLVNPAYKVIADLKQTLEANDLCNSSPAKGHYEFYASGKNTDVFAKIIDHVLQCNSNIEIVDIASY